MKKFLLLFAGIVLMSGGCYLFAPNQEEKFVNPLFYEKLISLSAFELYIQLTPSSIYIKEDTHFDHNYKCKLTNNQLTTITLDCQKFDDALQQYVPISYTYTIKPCNQETHCLDEGGWIVYQKTEPDSFIRRAIYLIPSKEDDFPKDKFVNPMFYQELTPLPRDVDTTFLTPDSMIEVDANNQKSYKSCKMLANNPMFVTLRCLSYDDYTKKMRSDTYRYTLERCIGDDAYYYGGDWLVIKKYFDGASTAFVIKKEHDNVLPN